MNRKTQAQKTDNRFLKSGQVLGFNSFVRSEIKIGFCVCISIQKNSSLELLDKVKDKKYFLRLRKTEKEFLDRVDCLQCILIAKWVKDFSKKSSEVLKR